MDEEFKIENDEELKRITFNNPNPSEPCEERVWYKVHAVVGLKGPLNVSTLIRLLSHYFNGYPCGRLHQVVVEVDKPIAHIVGRINEHGL